MHVITLKIMSWRQKVHHDVKTYVKYVTMSKDMSWHKKVSLRQKVSHGVKRYVVIAKHHYAQNVNKKYVIKYIENIKKKHIMR